MEWKTETDLANDPKSDLHRTNKDLEADNRKNTDLVSGSDPESDSSSDSGQSAASGLDSDPVFDSIHDSDSVSNKEMTADEQRLQQIQKSLEKLRKYNLDRDAAFRNGLTIARDINAENYINHQIVTGVLYERCKCCGSVLIKRPKSDNQHSARDDRADLYANSLKSLPNYDSANQVYYQFQQSLMQQSNPFEKGDPYKAFREQNPRSLSNVSLQTTDGSASAPRPSFSGDPNENDGDYGKYLHSKNTGGDFDITAAEVLDDKKLLSSSQAYKQQLLENGCSGICILYDTGTCSGAQCTGCENSASDLCSRSYLLNSDYANLLEEDGGDYRAVIGSNMKEKQDSPELDEEFRTNLIKGEGKALEFLEEVRQYILHVDESNLLFQWKESTPKRFLEHFPSLQRRPLRVEVQMLLYIYKNYRLNIDIEHIENRFGISRYTLNWYLKQSYGYSYSKLLSTVRNEQSKCLLMIPSLRIGEIGTLVGYHSNYHYSLSFKRLEGISPKEYREFALSRNALRRRAGDR